LRNHIIDFLVMRSKTFTSTVTNHDPRNVPVVRIGLAEPTIVASLPGLTRQAIASG
jgi:nitrate/nitrite transport system ATP-binding protein